MTRSCQIPRPTVVAVTGVAGSGKTTLGRTLAQALALPLVDLDSVTTPLLDALGDTIFGTHWLTSAHAPAIRAGRYAALRAVAADAVSSAGGAVLVAPFTAELAGGDDWRRLHDAVAAADLRVVHLSGDPQLFAARRAARGEARDAHRDDIAPAAPAVEVITIDAELSTSQQIARLLPELGLRRHLDPDAALFSRTFDAVLFDLDGTLVDSTASVVRSWRRFAEHYGVSAEALHENHGQPARVLISKLLPADLFDEGLSRVTDLEVDDAVDLAPVRGARAFFDAVPVARRAIVTSGTHRLASARLGAAGFTPPDVFVTADDVTRGKPDPEPFLTAAAALGVDPARCLVVEDAAAGIAAARAAGCSVLALTGTVEAHELPGDVVLDGLDVVELEATGDGLRLRVR
ncbi:HAD-IA family hydrolase [Microbacterium sp. NPDC080220]|uniref:HAD-IA family hydrolase n=1 Tax=Microbacterium sp. NPDC080220 TaxID=3161017 RepID=UPI003418D430